MIKKYFTRHFRFNDVFEEHPEHETLQQMPRRRRSRSFFIFVRFLKLLPALCTVAFVVSFFIDFGTKDTLSVLGKTLPLDSLIRMVAVSGLIGFGTNWIAIKMLFKPVFRRPIWGQGLIPAQKDRIVWQLAGGIHRHILNEELIKDRIEQSGMIKKINSILIDGTENLLHDEEFRREIKAVVYKHLKTEMAQDETRERFTTMIDQKLDANLNRGLPGFVFQAYKRINRREYELILNNVLDRVPGTVVEIIEEVEKESEAITSAIRGREEEMEAFFLRLVIDVLERIDIRTLLSRQMAHFDEAKLEEMIWTATNEQLLYIQYLGTLLGIFGGFLIWQPMVMSITYLSLLSTLFVADQILHRIKKNRLGSRKTQSESELPPTG